MKVKEMIQENNRLRERLTPDNRSYLEDMIIQLRESPVDPVKTEELLLQAAHDLLEAQERGMDARQLFGDDPLARFRDVINSVPPRPARSKTSQYIMISWIALTLLFGALGAAGLAAVWATGDPGVFGRISVFTLIVIGGGSIVLIELLMKWMAGAPEQDRPLPGKFNIKALGLYIGAAVAVIVAGLFLDRLLPVIPLSPWVAIGIFVAGSIGYMVFFRRK